MKFTFAPNNNSKPYPKLEIIYLMIGVSALIALIFLGFYIWAVKDGQFDDTYTPSVRMLFDDIEVYNGNYKSTKKEIDTVDKDNSNTNKSLIKNN